VGKGFSLVVGVTAAGGPEGQSPYGNSPLANLGSNPALSVSLCLRGKKAFRLSQGRIKQMDYRNQEMKLYPA
jgi:hypothetical protein